MTDTCPGVVVIVEDDEDTRELLREILEEAGHTVATAADGVQGLEVLRSTPCVCLVLLDLVMPRLGGLGVLAAIAEDPSLSSLPVCISTSAAEQAPPGLPCLPKPVDIDRLNALVAARC